MAAMSRTWLQIKNIRRQFRALYQAKNLFPRVSSLFHFKQRRLVLLKHCLIIFENCNHVAAHNFLDDGFTKTEGSKVEFNS